MHLVRGGRAVALAIPLFVGLFLASAAAAETRRFAIVLGNNAGAAERATLRFAETDAMKLSRVLIELGDVREEDLFLLTGRGVADVERAVREVRSRVDELHREPDTRAVVLFYYSGHSDGEALELGRERLSYATLKAMLAGTRAELKVAIIDACKSGAAVLEKGGRPAPGFTIRLSDQLTARGEVFITSSAQDEASLESSEVMGSYFTHNFISGLRGAADSTGDRQVTLAEAYRYAYDRTVSATAITPNGAQHPAYDYKLQGTGELVLSSLLRGSSSMELPSGSERAVVTDLSRDQVVAEVMPGAAREIALAPGIYGVRLLRGGQTWGGRFKVEKNTRYAVRWEDLEQITSHTRVAMKGAGHPPPLGEGRGEGAEGHTIPASHAVPRSAGPGDTLLGPSSANVGGSVAPTSNSASAMSPGAAAAGARVAPHGQHSPGAASNSMRRGGPMFGLSLGGASAVTEGAGLQGSLRLSVEPTPKTGFSFALQAAGGSGLTSAIAETSVQARVGYRAALRGDRIFFSVGAEAGAAHLWIGETRTQLGFVAGPRAAFRVRVGGPAWLGVEGEVPLTMVSESSGVRAVLTPSAVLGMALEL